MRLTQEDHKLLFRVHRKYPKKPTVESPPALLRMASPPGCSSTNEVTSYTCKKNSTNFYDQASYSPSHWEKHNPHQNSKQENKNPIRHHKVQL